MDVSIQRSGCIERRFMSLGLEILAGQTLIFDKGCIEVKILNNFVIYFMHLIIERLRFRSCVSQTPGAGEIIEISTALLSRENIKDNCLAKSHQVVGVANRMAHSGIPTNGKDRALRLRCTTFCEPE